VNVASSDASCENAIEPEKPIDSFLTDGWSTLRYVDQNINGVSGVAYMSITCAVCEKLDNDLILGRDVVAKLNRRLMLDQSSKPVSICDVNVDTTTVYCGDVCENDVNCELNDNSCHVAKVMHNDAEDDIQSLVDGDNSDDVCSIVNPDDKTDDVSVTDKNANVADVEQLALEQHNDKSLNICWSLAKRAKGGYYIRNGILYRQDKILGHDVEQLCLPISGRAQAIRLAHETFGGHLAYKKTKFRLKLSFTWPTIAADVQSLVKSVMFAQKGKRVTVYDRVPIAPVPSNEVVFDNFVMDCFRARFPEPKGQI